MDDTDTPPIGLLLRLLDLHVTRLAADRLADIDVSPAEMSVLGTIDAAPGLRASAVAAALMIKPPNLTKLVNGLEARAFVRRTVSREDERAVALDLTPKGKRAVAFGQQLTRDIERVLLADVPPDMRDRLLPALTMALRAAQRASRRMAADTPG